MYLKRLYKDMEFKMNSFLNACDMLKDSLNEQFYGDADDGIVVDVFYQPSDGFIIVWEDNNSVFDIDEIENLNSREEFEKYLAENSI